MKKTKTPQTPQLQEPDTQSKRRLSLPKVAYSAFLCVMMSMIFCQPAYAATDVWTKAKEIMQDVYTQILAISTIAAIVTASVALLLMNFSRSGRTVDESRAWLKRICITWAILNGLGFADFNSVMLVIIGVCANGAVALITLILVLILAWNYLKLLFEAAERYVLLGVLVYTAPVAFSMGASQTTANIWKSWCRMLGGQIFLLVMNAWCLRLFTSMVGSFLANPLSL